MSGKDDKTNRQPQQPLHRFISHWISCTLLHPEFSSIAFSCLSISMIICIVAPGNYERIVILDQMKGPQPHTISQLLSGFSDYMLQKKYILAFLLAMLWMPLGIILREKSRKEITRKQVTKLLLISAIPIVLSILICCLFQIFALKFIPVPAKGWTFTSVSIQRFSVCFF